MRGALEAFAATLGVGAPGSAAALGMEAAALPAPVRPAVPPVLLCGLGLWGMCAVLYAASMSWAHEALLLAFAAGALGVVIAVVGLWRHGARAAWCLLLGCALGACCAAGGAAQMQERAESAQLAGLQLYRFELLEDARAGSYGSSALARTWLPDGSACSVLLRFSENVEARYGDVVVANVSLSAPAASQEERCWQSGAAAVANVSAWSDGGEADGAKRVLLAVRNAAVDAILQQEGSGREPSPEGDAGSVAVAGASTTSGEREEGDSASSPAFSSESLEGGDVFGAESCARAVLAALVCGYRGDLSGSDTYEDFKTAGLAHLVAVSGAHFAVVGALALALLRACGLSARAAFGAQGLLMAGYLVVSAVPISALRAALMACCGLLSFAARRRPASANALGLCIVALVAANPATAVSVSFALSAASTLGIVLFASLFGGWLGRWAPALPQAIFDALAVTAATWVTSLPISAALFSQVSLVSPAANVAASPLFSVVCAAGMLGAVVAVALPAAAGLALAPGLLGSELLCLVAKVAAAVPFAAVPADVGMVFAVGASVVLSWALWRFWPQPSARSAACVGAAGFACALAVGAFAPRLAGTEVVMLDVGQGDAFLVRSRGAAVLIDTGNRDQLLREALARHGIFRLDAVVISHADDDHCGSLDALASVVEVGRVCMAADALECPCASCTELREDASALVGEDGLVGLEVGNTLQVGDISFLAVWPYEFADEGGNGDSLTLLASADADGDGAADATALFCGDAEAEQLASMVEAGSVSHVDLLKVGHHGSKAALMPELASTLSPSLALVSVGEGNRYGHPAQTTLDALEEAGASVLRTDETGDVSCKLTAGGIRVSTLR